MNLVLVATDPVLWVVMNVSKVGYGDITDKRDKTADKFVVCLTDIGLPSLIIIQRDQLLVHEITLDI